jgi:Fe-S oxidoreductase
VLAAGGYRVHVARPADGGRPLCCGRTFLAAGLVEEARCEARRTLAALGPHVARGLPVIGLEPSCLGSLRDEFTALLPGLDSDALADCAVTLEEFLAAEHEAGRLELGLGALDGRKALVHGHCHQKAFGAFGEVADVLRLIPGLEVATIETSCCGMAGAFGYEAEHYDISMKMAEISLLPAVRSAPGDAIVVADGVSCRQQIAHGAGRQAIHAARLLEMALDAGAEESA